MTFAEISNKMKRLWVIFFVLPLFSQDAKKHNISIGMWDDKTGFSFIAYTYNIKQTVMDEFFIGAGTMILGYTGSIGWKHYYYKSKLSIYSVLSGQRVDNFLFIGFMPTGSISLEYKLFKKTQVKMGLMALEVGGRGSKAFSEVFPFFGLNWNY